MIVAMIGVSQHDTDPAQLAQHARTGGDIQGPEPRRLAERHAEIRRAFDVFPNPLDQLVKGKQ